MKRERTPMRMMNWLAMVLVLFLIREGAGFANTPREERTTLFGVSAGIGIPKIPFSQFRTPISILGGGSINLHITRKVAMRLDGNLLHTFSFGTINDQGGDLQFDLLWASGGLMYCLRGPVGGGGAYLLAGSGWYRLSQMFGDEEDRVETDRAGFHLGLIHWTHLRGWSSSFELRWHLLFKPSSNPQVLTITFGILL